MMRKRRSAYRLSGSERRGVMAGLGLGSAIGLVLLFGAAALSESARAAEGDGAIGERQVMGVEIGMSIEDAKAAAPDLTWTYQPQFMVDFSAACASKGGSELFCGLVFENPTETGGDRIEAIAVTSPALATPEGARVGASLEEVAQIYGPARLAFSVEDESREYVWFENSPDWLAFRADRDGHAGVYPPAQSDQTYYETTDYKPGAVVSSIWVN